VRLGRVLFAFSCLIARSFSCSFYCGTGPSVYVTIFCFPSPPSFASPPFVALHILVEPSPFDASNWCSLLPAPPPRQLSFFFYVEAVVLPCFAFLHRSTRLCPLHWHSRQKRPRLTVLRNLRTFPTDANFLFPPLLPPVFSPDNKKSVRVAVADKIHCDLSFFFSASPFLNL